MARPRSVCKGQGRFGKYRRLKKASRPYRVDAIHHNHRPSDHRLHRVLFVEQGEVDAKIAAMFSDKRKAEEANKLLEEISTSVRRYIWFKTIVVLFIGVACYVVLRFFDIDFAESWALLIFVLNYIPNIGSIVAVAFPCLLALVQFETLTPFLFLVTSLT